MKDIFKNAASLFGYVVIAGVMCTICFISMKMIFNFVFTDSIGYEVRGTIGDSQEKEFLYKYYYTEDDETGKDDDKWAQYEEEGYTLYKYDEKSKLSHRANVTMVVITQIVCLFSTGCFVFDILNKRGYKDGTLVRSGSRKPDKFKGLKIGLIASVPALITYLLFIIFSASNKGVALELYMIFNACFWSTLELLFTSSNTASDITVWQFIVMFLLQMVIPALSQLFYYLGYKDYEFLGKIVYKSKKKGR